MACLWEWEELLLALNIFMGLGTAIEKREIEAPSLEGKQVAVISTAPFCCLAEGKFDKTVISDRYYDPNYGDIVQNVRLLVLLNGISIPYRHLVFAVRMMLRKKVFAASDEPTGIIMDKDSPFFGWLAYDVFGSDYYILGRPMNPFNPVGRALASFGPRSYTSDSSVADPLERVGKVNGIDIAWENRNWLYTRKTLIAKAKRGEL